MDYGATASMRGAPWPGTWTEKMSALSIGELERPLRYYTFTGQRAHAVSVCVCVGGGGGDEIKEGKAGC